MPAAFPSWKTKCANLAERGKVKQKQSHEVYRKSPLNRERQQNKRADCKTEFAGDPPELETKTAAQAGPLNGGNAIEKHSSAFRENGYHNAADAATRAGRWYAENRQDCLHPVIPTLRRMFSLSALEAVQAIREANGGAR